MSAGKLTEQAKGVFIIAATPFTDEGALDLNSVDSLTDFYLGCGVTRIHPSGHHGRGAQAHRPRNRCRWSNASCAARRAGR